MVILSEITHLVGNCLLFIVALAFSLVLGVRATRLCLQLGWEQVGDGIHYGTYPDFRDVKRWEETHH